MTRSQHSSRALQALALICLSSLLVWFALVWHDKGQPHVQDAVLVDEQVGQSRIISSGNRLLQLEVVARQLGVDLDDETAGILGYRRPGARNAGPLPSTRILADRAEDLAGVAVVSVVLDPRDWKGEDGIFTNPYQRGKDSHRGACASWFVDGELVGESTVGVCIHGGTSRKMREKSLRLMFRPRYGPTMRPADIVPGAMGSNLVLHNDVRDRPFCNPMAYEVMAHLGCDVPRCRPVRLVVNGEVMKNVYFATEHLDESYFAAKLGHENVLIHDERGGRTRKYGKAISRVMFADDLKLQSLEGLVDIESIVSWLVGVLICNTCDNRQGVAYLDEYTARWQWVVWDLDWSFQAWPDPTVVKWVKGRTVTENLTIDMADIRSTFFARHMPQDCEFRRRLLGKLSEAWNHELTVQWFEDLFRRYHDVATAHGKQRKFHGELDEMLQFVLDRPERIAAELEDTFGIGPVFTASVRVPAGVAVKVDGYRYERDVTCRYFAGQQMSVVVPPGYQLRRNGEPVAAGASTFEVDRDSSFEVVRR